MRRPIVVYNMEICSIRENYHGNWNAFFCEDVNEVPPINLLCVRHIDIWMRTFVFLDIYNEFRWIAWYCECVCVSVHLLHQWKLHARSFRPHAIVRINFHIRNNVMQTNQWLPKMSGKNSNLLICSNCEISSGNRTLIHTKLNWPRIQ